MSVRARARLMELVAQLQTELGWTNSEAFIASCDDEELVEIFSELLKSDTEGST